MWGCGGDDGDNNRESILFISLSPLHPHIPFQKSIAPRSIFQLRESLNLLQ
jgi:hypothetical protein